MSRRGVVRLRVTCPIAGRPTLSLKRGSKTLGKKRFRVRAGRAVSVRIKFSKTGRRTVNRARRNRLRASATISSIRQGRAARTGRTTKRITIRAPR